MKLLCPLCGRALDFSLDARACPSCGSPLFLELVEPSAVRKFLRGERRPSPGVWSFPLTAPCPSPSSSLGEAFTPSPESPALAGKLGVSRLIVKNESTNPTGTFIDRGSAVGVWVAKVFGAKRVVAVGLGDYVVSVSSYAAFHGVRVLALTPSSTPLGKVYRALLTGAEVISCGSLAECAEKAQGVAEGDPFCVHASPLFVEGYKTLLYELALNPGVDHVVVPVGDGVLLASLYKACLELQEAGVEPPRLHGVMVEVRARVRTLEELVGGDPRARRLAERASRELGGDIVRVEARDVLRAVHYLARAVGVVVDPSAAAGLAGAARLADHGAFDPRDSVAVVVTGSSLRDPVALMEVLACVGRLPRTTERLELLHRSKLVVLRALAEEGRLLHAKELLLRIAEKGVRIRLSTLLAHLRWLEERGYVESTKVGGRRAYSITEKGLEALRALEEA